jgi:predicted TIM-barrel fold metal-dependent hydrolase
LLRDMFVFDNVVHMYDNTPDNVINPIAKNNLERMHKRFSRPGSVDHEDFQGIRTTVDEALRSLFAESCTDMAQAQTVPLFGFWREGFAPARLQYELSQASPERVVFCGGVDPVYQGRTGAVVELQRQVEEWGAVSMKFYKAHGPRIAWRADDRELAYPLWEKCLELGVSNVQFHCGVPLGTERMEDLRPNDIQAAAADFPTLQFVIHHVGDPYVDESIAIAGRFENVWLSLSSTVVNIWPTSPWWTYERLGKALMVVGPDRLLWGSEAFIWPDIQGLLNIFDQLQMPEELQDRYGFPEITESMRRKILGLNQARLLGMDVRTTLNRLYPDLDEDVLARACGEVA